jgi:hypothetical protein
VKAQTSEAPVFAFSFYEAHAADTVVKRLAHERFAEIVKLRVKGHVVPDLHRPFPDVPEVYAQLFALYRFFLGRGTLEVHRGQPDDSGDGVPADEDPRSGVQPVADAPHRLE